MTITDYSEALNERLYSYLEAEVNHHHINPFILKFSLIIEPLKTILATPLVIQDGPKSFKAQELMQLKFSRFYLRKINQDLILLAKRCQ